MKGETHALVGAATAVMVTNPVTFSGLVLAAITGALGGLYCDIDSAKSIGKRVFNTIIGIAILGSTFAVYVIANFMPDIYEKWRVDDQLVIKIGCFIGLIIMTFIGKESSHRKVTHSIEFTGVVFCMLYFIDKNVASCFALGMISHIAIDLLNKRPVRLSVLFDIDFCFNLCYSDGIISKFLSVIAAVIVTCHQGGKLLHGLSL